MAVTGDFAKLQKTIDGLLDMAESSALTELNRALAEQYVDLIREGFSNEQDPSGKAWAPLKRRSGKILQDTGRLRSGFAVKAVTARGFSVTASVSYSTYHQSGTSRMPARQMVPEGELPPAWEKALAETIEDFAKAKLG